MPGFFSRAVITGHTDPAASRGSSGARRPTRTDEKRRNVMQPSAELGAIFGVSPPPEKAAYELSHSKNPSCGPEHGVKVMEGRAKAKARREANVKTRLAPDAAWPFPELIPGDPA